jgi:hypothetical protein
MVRDGVGESPTPGGEAQAPACNRKEIVMTHLSAIFVAVIT